MDKNLKENDTELYLTHNVGKSVIAERFSRTLKNKINKYMMDTAKDLYIDELEEINRKYNNTFYFPIKMKAIDFISGTVMEYIPQFNKKESNFKV